MNINTRLKNKTLADEKEHCLKTVKFKKELSKFVKSKICYTKCSDCIFSIRAYENLRLCSILHSLAHNDLSFKNSSNYETFKAVETVNDLIEIILSFEKCMENDKKMCSICSLDKGCEKIRSVYFALKKGLEDEDERNFPKI